MYLKPMYLKHYNADKALCMKMAKMFILTSNKQVLLQKFLAYRQQEYEKKTLT